MASFGTPFAGHSQGSSGRPSLESAQPDGGMLRVRSHLLLSLAA